MASRPRSATRLPSGEIVQPRSVTSGPRSATDHRPASTRAAPTNVGVSGLRKVNDRWLVGHTQQASSQRLARYFFDVLLGWLYAGLVMAAWGLVGAAAGQGAWR